jgi:hypothetical protein
LDAIEAERREIREKRFTSLDRLILRAAASGSENPSSTLTITIDGRGLDHASSTSLRVQHLLARLGVLEDMGLGRHSGKGAWSIRADFENVLRAMQRASDRQKTLKAHGAVLSDERLPAGVLDFRQIPSVEGRVIVHGEDEQSGRRYLILEGVDARVHYVDYTPQMEVARARGELRTNSFVRLCRGFIDEEAMLQVEDFGNSESLLNNRSHFEKKARELLQQGVVPVEQGLGGWLGKYQAALKQTAMEVQHSPHPRRQVRERSRGR